jgi:hypothetical protein
LNKNSGANARHLAGDPRLLYFIAARSMNTRKEASTKSSLSTLRAHRLAERLYSRMKQAIAVTPAGVTGAVLLVMSARGSGTGMVAAAGSLSVYDHGSTIGWDRIQRLRTV